MKDKIVVITGASSGIGEALAQVDRIVCGRQVGDLGEDGRGVRGESADRHGGSLGRSARESRGRAAIRWAA